MKQPCCLVSVSFWGVGGLFFVSSNVQWFFMVVSTYSWRKGLRDSTLKIFVIQAFLEITFDWGYQAYLAGPGQRGCRWHSLLWNEALEMTSQGRDTLGHCEWPQPGQEHKESWSNGWNTARRMTEKQKETNARRAPTSCATPCLVGETGTGWISPQQKQCLRRPGKREMVLLYDAGSHDGFACENGWRTFYFVSVYIAETSLWHPFHFLTHFLSLCSSLLESIQL